MLDGILDSIRKYSCYSPHQQDQRSMLHAYVACLPLEDLCVAIAITLTDSVTLRLTLRHRLLRLLRENSNLGHNEAVVMLVRAIRTEDKNTKVRQAIDALYSALFEHLPIPIQQEILENWIDRGTRGAMARWFKATESLVEHFEEAVAISYWRSTQDWRAAKSIAYHARPTTLAEFLPELVEQYVEGWILSKAVLRSSYVDEATWRVIRDLHPATYLYLCAKLNRRIENDEAISLVKTSAGPLFGDMRGLAIWAIGQMKMVAALDQIGEILPELSKRDFDAYLGESSILGLRGTEDEVGA